MTERMRLIDTYTLGTEGVFEGFDDKGIITNTEGVALEYYYSHSGAKYVSPLYTRIYEVTEDHTETSGAVAEILLQRYSDKWLKVKEALLNSNYSPLIDYEHTEERSHTTDRSVTYGSNVAQTGSSSNKETTEQTLETESALYGFNSSLPVNDSSSNSTQNRTSEGIMADNQSESSTAKTGTDKSTDKLTETITKSGRNASGADLIQKELNLRDRNIYLGIIFNDIDKLLTLSIY